MAAFGAARSSLSADFGRGIEDGNEDAHAHAHEHEDEDVHEDEDEDEDVHECGHI